MQEENVFQLTGIELEAVDLKILGFKVFKSLELEYTHLLLRYNGDFYAYNSKTGQ